MASDLALRGDGRLQSGVGSRTSFEIRLGFFPKPCIFPQQHMLFSSNPISVQSSASWGPLPSPLPSWKCLSSSESALVRTEVGRASGGRLALEEIKDTPLTLQKLPAKGRRNAKPNHVLNLCFNAIPLRTLLHRQLLPGKETAGSGTCGDSSGRANLIPTQTLPHHPSLCPHLTPESTYP